jgi:choline kinase
MRCGVSHQTMAAGLVGQEPNNHVIWPANGFTAVQIAEPPPASPGNTTPKHYFTATSSRRLSGRPALPGANSSRNSLISQSSLENLSSLVNATPPTGAEDANQSSRRHRIDHLSHKLLGQVAEWLDREKTKRETRKSKKRFPSRRKSKSPPIQDGAGSGTATPAGARSRAASVTSDSSEVSLDALQRIVDEALGLNASGGLGRKHSKRSLSHRSLTKVASSDTEYYDNNDILVPSCDGFLDNSKSLSYTGGKSGGADDGASISGRKEDKEKQAWLAFKNEIIRLAHTLRLKGWRRVPLDSGDLISVERLSGALTNAVYVVTPPKDLPAEEGKKAPTKVLLRIYGPQVDIDRENELSMLRRLARKKIGPRLLGTFLNGRFEQFFNAATLTPANLREPETSKQIAKRMRELHDGITLLDEERVEGPSVWKNWDRWVDQAAQRVTALDKHILEGRRGSIRKPGDAWKARGLVCGVEWAVFKATVDKYRKFLEKYYGDQKKIREKLVFAHNDVGCFPKTYR